MYQCRIVIAVGIMMVWTLSISHAYAASKLPLVRIAFVRDGPWHRFPGSLSLLKKEILDLTSREFDVRFPQKKNIECDLTISCVRHSVARLLKDPEVDLIIALGFFASNELCHRKNLRKPVIAVVVLDAKLQGFPSKKGASGVKNLYYVDSLHSIEREINLFQDVVPFNNLAVLIDKAFVPEIPMLASLKTRVEKKERIGVGFVPVGRSATAALQSIPPQTDAVFVTPLLQLSRHEFAKLVSGLIKRRLPSFSSWGKEEVEEGLLVGVTLRTDFDRLARRIALTVQRILLGEDAGTIKVAFTPGRQLTVNMATARAIGVSPSWNVLAEADLLHEQDEKTIQRKLSMESAVREAIAANLDLAASERKVAAGEQDVIEGRSALLPQMDLSLQGVAIDRDQAEASMGQQAERSFSGSASLSQLIYSESAWSNYDVQQHLQTSRIEENESLKLDIALEAATAYLDYLRSRTFERIEKENLKVTRANLERARIRESVGFTGSAEVYRWESKIATGRKDVLESIAQRQQALIALNRVLNRPLEEQFIAVEATLNDPLLLISDKRFFKYVNNPHSFQIFCDFTVKEGIENAPELRQLTASIEAEKRVLLSSRRAYWMPIFSLEGDLTRQFARGGAGADFSTGLPNMPQNDDTDWSVALVASFPLFEGGAKSADLNRSRENVAKLTLDREATAQRIEEKIRSSLKEISASYPAIKLSRDSAEASDKNLKLVTDSYVQGVVSIVDLLDAQNSALVSDLAAANAVYDFLIDLMNMQRASGQFDFLLTREERNKWFERLETFFAKHVRRSTPR